MIPILYSATETVAQLVADKTNGLGRLPDAASCKVTEERNGAFTLEMTYPITGLHYADIAIGGVIKAKPNELADAQLFRVYHITKPLNGVVTIDAQHITYDLGKAVVKPFTAKGIQSAVSSMLKNMIGGSGFSFSSDIENSGSTLTNEIPQSFRAILGGQDGSFLDVFGGEYEWNNAKVILHSHRGSNNGVTIRYGKNLTDIKQEENISETYTAVYPYVLNSDQKVITGSLQTVIETSEPKVLALDLSSKFQSIGAGTEQKDPTAAEINAEAQKYIKANNIGTPKVSIDVSFVQLWQTAEYKNIAPLERVSLCDTVTVQFDKLGVSATAKVIETVYDVLAEHYESISLGDAKSSLASTIASAPEKAEIQKQTSSALESAITRATKLITGQKGGHVVIKGDANGKPQELLIMDTEDETTATKVWRWNLSGLGYSPKGVNGEYGTAITQDGEIVADYITTGDLNAQIITTGILKDRQGNNSWNLDTGELSLHAYETKTDASKKLTSANSHADSAASTAETNAKAYADTQIKVSAEGITADVSKTYETKTDASKKETTLKASIKANADNIALKVSSEDYNGNKIVSLLNLDDTTATISASKIDLSGYVTISSLGSGGSTEIDGSRITTGTISADRLDLSSCLKVGQGYVKGSDLKTKGSTTINGGNITTGTISADRIDADNLTVKAANVTGTFTADKIKGGSLLIKPSTATYYNFTAIEVWKDPYSKLMTIGNNGIVMNDKSYISEMALNNTGLHVYPQNSGGGSVKVGSGGIQTFYNNNVQFTAIGNKIGFFGATPVTQWTLNPSTATIVGIVNLLKHYGLA